MICISKLSPFLAYLLDDIMNPIVHFQVMQSLRDLLGTFLNVTCMLWSATPKKLRFKRLTHFYSPAEPGIPKRSLHFDYMFAIRLLVFLLLLDVTHTKRTFSKFCPSC